MEKHFKYEANIDLKAKSLFQDFEIQDIQFLVPINIKNTDGSQILANIDLVNQKIYFNDLKYDNEEFKLKIFKHLQQKSYIEEDLYEAKQEDYDDFDNARKQQEIIENSLQEEQE